MKTLKLVITLDNLEEGLKSLDETVNEIRWVKSDSPYNVGFHRPIENFQDSIIRLNEKEIVIIRTLSFGKNNS